MREEAKKQLILSIGVLFIIIVSMVMWYDNFVFHTFVKQVDFQECFYGYNDSIMIDGYELGQDSQGAFYGGARMLATSESLFRKNDTIHLIVTLTNSENQEMNCEHTYKVKNTNEVVNIEMNTLKKLEINTDIIKAKAQVIIKRGKKEVYNESITLQTNGVFTYTVGNKDYKIQDVFVSDTWLKTGYFSSTVSKLSDTYEYCIIDYTYLKTDGDRENLDDYERIAQIALPVDELLLNNVQKTYYYNDEGSLLDKDLICFVTLKHKKDEDLGITFVIELKQITKAGVVNG